MTNERRTVRISHDVFDELDRVLGAERGPDGEPSVRSLRGPRQVLPRAQAALGSRSWPVSAMSMPRVAAMSQMRARLAERYSVAS